MSAKGKNPEELTLPNWEIFIELIRNILENPHLSFKLPYLFQRASIDIQKENKFLSYTCKEDLLLLKFAVLTSNYLCLAAQTPLDLCNLIRKYFEDIQSGIIHEE